MALDDIMSCIARGMLLGFVTLVLGVLALALSYEPATAAQIEERATGRSAAKNRDADHGGSVKTSLTTRRVN
jgi:hypothetical protein